MRKLIWNWITVIGLILFSTNAVYAVPKPFISADLNGNGRIDDFEVVLFTDLMAQAFTYQMNDFALSADEFFSQRGGDCEDWAIFTCEMLRFWGETAYVATVDSPDGFAAHAIVLWKNDTIDESYYDVTNSYTYVTGRPIPSGRYIPIDYDLVGGVGYYPEVFPTLRYMFEPQNIIDQRM